MRHIPNDRVFINKVHLLLLNAASLDQLSDGSKPKRIMCKGYLAGLIDAVAIVMVDKIQEPYENTYTRNTACFEHGLRPFVCIGSYQRSPLKQPYSALLYL